MPTIDFGSVTLSVDDGRVDLFFPREHGEVKDLVKGMGGRWNDDRKCWIVVSRFARKSEEDIVAAVEDALWASAPGKWRDAVAHYGSIACTTRKYEVKFGAGGIRLTLPDGHPCHWTLDKLDGAGRKPRGQTWTIPARSAKPSVMLPIIERAVREDRKAFLDAVGPYEGRTLRGTVPLSPVKADDLGLSAGRVVFAEYSFVKAADPTIVNMPVHAWPFIVASRDDKPGEGYEHLEEGVSLKLEYIEAEHAWKAVRKLMSMPDDQRPQRLDAPHAVGKWHARMRR